MRKSSVIKENLLLILGLGVIVGRHGEGVKS